MSLRIRIPVSEGGKREKREEERFRVGDQEREWDAIAAVYVDSNSHHHTNTKKIIGEAANLTLSMVLKRVLECGSIGYDAPTIPRAPRSARKRILYKKKVDEEQLCAFELLAAVAGKLLQESETSSASSNAAVGVSKEFIKQEFQYNVEEVTRTEQEEQGSSEESVVSSAICLQKKSTLNVCKKEAVNTSSKEIIEKMSYIAISGCSGKVGSDLKPLIHTSEDGLNELLSKIDGGSLKCGDSFGPNVDTRIGIGQEAQGGTADKFISRVLVESCGKISPPIPSSEGDDLGQCRGLVPDHYHAKHMNHVKVEGIDDEEILSKCSNPIAQKGYGLPTSADNCQIRNLLTSKYWKSAPKLKDCQLTNSGTKRNHIGKSCYQQERSQQNTPFKKRKLFGQTSVVTHDGGVSSESVSNINAKRASNWSGSATKQLAGNKISSSSADCRSSLSSSQVKLSVKSFKVPELLIEVPESASVGSLKKTVLDAITTVLGGGLRVGVLLHGKKIRDDSKTLRQTGISEYDNLKDLNFILEPSSPTPLSLNSSMDDCSALPTCPLPKHYVNRTLNTKQELSLLEKRDNTSAATGSGRIYQDLVSESRALVPVPTFSAVPINTRPRCTEIGQRRTRRPFSVSEVEALVEAVENLGTGRWRDVKLCAFENAKHRTYVDLKDKWKTLVHTARISPQQRRGEPVPQQLLNRVLAAHAYWSQSHQQAKHHPKHPALLNNPHHQLPASSDPNYTS